MKPRLKIVNTKQNEVFQIMNVLEPYFYPSWHFHPEYEIMLVQEGAGMRFVGDNMERFQKGDLVFYGANIPHLYRSDEAYYEKKSALLSKATVVYFKEGFLGESFWDLPDLISVKKLFSLSKRGIKFKGKTKDDIKKQLLYLEGKTDGMGKIIGLLNILKTMAEAKEYDLLSSNAFTKFVDKDECERINKVYQYIIDNYSENPSLVQVSDIANMCTTAFCRYFKSHTNKTYTQFLNEIKIGNACRLLQDRKLSISQVCFEIGFNNSTHFNTQFKRIIGLTPKMYQETHFLPNNTNSNFL